MQTTWSELATASKMYSPIVLKITRLCVHLLHKIQTPTNINELSTIDQHNLLHLLSCAYIFHGYKDMLQMLSFNCMPQMYSFNF